MLLDTEEKIRLGASLVASAIPKKDIPEIGALLGDMNTCIGSRSCNGVPLFGTVLMIHKEDWKLIANAYNDEMKRLETLKV